MIVCMCSVSIATALDTSIRIGNLYLSEFFSNSTSEWYGNCTFGQLIWCLSVRFSVFWEIADSYPEHVTRHQLHYCLGKGNTHNASGCVGPPASKAPSNLCEESTNLQGALQRPKRQVAWQTSAIPKDGWTESRKAYFEFSALSCIHISCSQHL